MDITNIFAALGSALSGGLLGVAGTGIKLWAEQKTLQAKYQFQLKMRQLDQEEMTLENELRMREITAESQRDIAVANQTRLAAESTAQADIEQADIQLQQESYKQDRAQYGGGFVDGVRGLMRPMLTTYFAVLMALIAYQLTQLTQGLIDPDSANAMLTEVVNSCIFLAVASVTWWFGSRPTAAQKG